MPKFIHVTGTDGVEHLMNTDFVCASQVDEKTLRITTSSGLTINTQSYSFGALKNLLCKEDTTQERIADNTFHIWEILRARLH